jgi:hypothetical protein
LTAPLLLGLICFLVYNANLRQIGAGDTFPARYLPLILWHNGTLDLDQNVRMVAHGHSTIPFWTRPAGVAGEVTPDGGHWSARSGISSLRCIP